MNSKKNLLDHDPNIVVAIDFDGTLTIESCVSDFFSYNLYAIEQAKKIKNLGVTLILWTCREGDILSQITKELKKYELIRNILNQKDCFLNMRIEYAYSILRDLQIPENEIKNVYTQLINLNQNER